MDMKYSSIQLTDLPDEILLIIFRKLNNIELLYSLMDVHPRFDNILNESIFTNRLSFVKFLPSYLVVRHTLFLYFIYPLLDRILDRFCVHILPKIHEKVKWFDLDSSSIERIFLAANYPNLCGMRLFNIKPGRLVQLFSDQRFLINTYKNQILSLVIDLSINDEPSSIILLNANGEPISICDMCTIIFSYIFHTFPNLRSLNYCPSATVWQRLFFDESPSTVFSSTLLELRVCLGEFKDCLYLLDGRFNQLRVLYVKIYGIDPSDLIIDNKEKLPNLDSFALYCDTNTDSYDELILPLLHRMLNLKTLDLSLPTLTQKPFIDGQNFTQNIINHMPLLNQFAFHIHSLTSFYNPNNIPSNEYIQETFRDFPNKQIHSDVDYFQESGYSQCHIYSYPYPSQVTYYKGITNHFPGGLFQCVREVSLRDERPFEHEFFLRISQSFPFMERLRIHNQKAQRNKQFRKSPNEHLSIIEFPYLGDLCLDSAHEDYYEQFLFENKSCLPNDIRVTMDYRLAKEVTHNFRRNITRKNCAKIRFVNFHSKLTFPDHIKDYFPHARSLL